MPTVLVRHSLVCSTIRTVSVMALFLLTAQDRATGIEAEMQGPVMVVPLDYAER
jgi:hypothetical protein